MIAALLVLVALGAEDVKVTVDEVKVNGEPAPAVSKASSAGATASNAGQAWSVVTARTAGANANKLEAGVGFPGVSLAIVHGMTASFDLGGRVSVNYGWEGQVSKILPGVKVQALAKYKLYDNGKINLGAGFAPGLLFYFPSRSPTEVGFAIPLSLTLGIIASSALAVGVTLELPMWVRFGTGSSFVLPILAGLGVEYFISSSLLVWFDLRMGPSIWLANTANTDFTFDGKLGVGWRF